MNWKEFFKPTGWKIFWTILLSIILFVDFLFVAFPTSAHYSSGISEITSLFLNPFLLLLRIPGRPHFGIGSFYGFLLITQVIYSYFIACLIIWIYDKRKKKWLE